MSRTFTVAGRRFALDRELVEGCVTERLPDPIRDHFVVVAGRRFPPKQVLCAVTGLDRADFTTHQARRILSRLGFSAGRRSAAPAEESPPESAGPHGGRQAEALNPFVGRWVALAGPAEVLVAAETPQEVVAWLSRHNRQATFGMFRVPETSRDAEGLAPS